jgi:MFS family permease
LRAQTGYSQLTDTRGEFPWRVQAPVYATAFFTGNVFPMMHVLMPLWALELTSSPLLIGLIISSRQLLPITMSIHGGALLDRFGPRQVIMVLGVSGALATGLFPVLPFIWAVIALQVVTGFAETTNWIGVQSAVGTILKGRPVYAGRMTAAARFGGFVGPLTAGMAWEALGPYGGFLFLAAWLSCGSVAATFLPRHEAEAAAGADEAPLEKKKADVMPRLSDYRDTIRLLGLSAIALVITATFMRQTGSGIQASFYGVWLKQELGLTGSTIGLLIGLSNSVSALAALSIGPLVRRFTDYWLLLVVVALSIVGITVTPMLDTVALLAIAICIRGAGQGLNLPLMMSIASRAVAPTLQGRVAALRITFNRLGNALFPLAMGGLAEAVGLENAFYAVGGAGLLLIGALSIWVLRSQDQFRSE